jgi:hypothetical protein
MGYRTFREPEPKHKEAVHPIWRGIGCLLILVFPLISFAASIILYQEGIPQQLFPLTRDLANMVTIPLLDETVPLFYILIITAVLTFLSYFALTVVYSMVFRMGSGSRYGPLDAPPIKRKVKKSR